MTEEWRTIPEHPLYEASVLGQIRRAPGTQRTSSKDAPLMAHPCGGGYLAVSMPMPNGQWSTTNVHRMVCSAFYGPPPSPKHHACHGNGIRLDNRAENLRWATAKENNADKVLHGTEQIGDTSSNHKLSSAAVAIIRKRLLMKEKQAVLAAEYGVSQTHVSRIKLGKVWLDPRLLSARAVLERTHDGSSRS